VASNSLKEIGRLGQKRYGGFFYEEFLKDLQGKKGVEVYREMSENDDVIGANPICHRNANQTSDVERATGRQHTKG
jgi:hypothetical protein